MYHEGFASRPPPVQIGPNPDACIDLEDVTEVALFVVALTPHSPDHPSGKRPFVLEEGRKSPPFGYKTGNRKDLEDVAGVALGVELRQLKGLYTLSGLPGVLPGGVVFRIPRGTNRVSV